MNLGAFNFKFESFEFRFQRVRASPPAVIQYIQSQKFYTCQFKIAAWCCLLAQSFTLHPVVQSPHTSSLRVPALHNSARYLLPMSSDYPALYLDFSSQHIIQLIQQSKPVSSTSFPFQDSTSRLQTFGPSYSLYSIKIYNNTLLLSIIVLLLVAKCMSWIIIHYQGLKLIFSDLQFSNLFVMAMRGTPPALQIAAENFPPVDVARSESGELSTDFKTPFAHT